MPLISSSKARTFISQIFKTMTLTRIEINALAVVRIRNSSENAQTTSRAHDKDTTDRAETMGAQVSLEAPVLEQPVVREKICAFSKSQLNRIEHTLAQENKNIKIKRKLKEIYNERPGMFKYASVKLKEMDAFLQEEMKNNSFSLSVFDGICLSGGGAKGIGHLGVIEALGTEGLNNMTQVSCASAGATMGLLVALGMAPDEIITEIKKQELKLNPILFDTQIKNALFDTLNDKMRGWSEEEIKNITFKQLSELKGKFGFENVKDLKISASWVSNQYNQIKNLEFSNKNAPNMPIYKAISASCALPLFMNRVVLNRGEIIEYFTREYIETMGMSEIENLKLMDGGITNNLPHNFLDKNKKNLILVFSEDDHSFERDLTMGEKTKNLLSNLSKRRINGLNPYSQRQSDLEQAHNNGNNFVYYIDPQVSTTQTKKATKNREEIISSVKKRFNNIILKSEEVQEDK